MKKYPETWKTPAWLERAFIYMAFFVAFVATCALILWLLVTFIVPFFTYSRETHRIVLSNGQVLQVKYPNLVLAEDTPIYVTLVLYGKSNGNLANFDVDIPNGLTVVEPEEQAYGKKLKLPAPSPGSDTEPDEIKIGLVNSRSEGGIWLLTRQPVVITSERLNDAQPIEIGVETIPWIAVRAIINNTINEKSALILLITGFLSGAGTFVIQYKKTQQERIKDEWQKVRDERQKKEQEFHDRLEKNPLVVLNHFGELRQDEGEDSDFSIYRHIVEMYGWEYRLQQIVLEKLKAKDYFETERAANVLGKLCEVFTPLNDTNSTDNFEHSQSLVQLSNLACIDDYKNHELTLAEVQCLRTIYRRWQELKPIVTNLVHGFVYLPANLPIVYEYLAPEEQGQLLRETNIHKIIETHINEFKDDNSEESQAVLAAAEKINTLLIPDVQWRDIRSRKERILTEKVQRWLAGRFFESIDANISLGSEYAELDSQQREPEIEHPVFKQLNRPFPNIVFGGEGMGKTVSALWLAGQHRKPTTTGVFPVYVPFESGIDLARWIVEKISRALTNFAADNPRKFITSSDSHKAAMGRLMFWHAQNIETLRLNLYSSPFDNNSSDIEQVLDDIKKFLPKQPPKELGNDEILNLFSLARPDVFDQIYFLWDIRSSSSHEDVLNKIREMASLADHLARQNVFVKIFAPLTVKQQLGDIGVIRFTNNDLTWDEAQLRELVGKKLDRFEALWDNKSVEDPIGMIVNAAEHSPRCLMKLLLRLMDYVDEHIQEEETLKKSDFEKIRLSLVEKK